PSSPLSPPHLPSQAVPSASPGNQTLPSKLSLEIPPPPLPLLTLKLTPHHPSPSSSYPGNSASTSSPSQTSSPPSRKSSTQPQGLTTSITAPGAAGKKTVPHTSTVPALAAIAGSAPRGK
ncbi:MAG: hypothetical protein Q9225_007955, partial [Loekoesia sp. 1 TL-2023]